MIARLQTVYISEGGWELGLPEECDIEIPDCEWHKDDRLDMPEGRKAFMVRRVNGVPVFRERRVHEPVPVAEVVK